MKSSIIFRTSYFNPSLCLIFKINPMHTVPTLKTDNLLITDSHAILIYLFQKYGGNDNPLWPGGDMRIEILNRMFYSATTFFRSYSDAIVINIPSIERLKTYESQIIYYFQCEIFKSRINAKTIKTRKYLDAIRQQYNNLNPFLSNTKYIACDQVR